MARCANRIRMSDIVQTIERKRRARKRAQEWRQKPGNAERESQTKAAWRQAHPEEWSALKRATNLRYNEAHRQEIRDKARDERIALKAKVIAAYGGRCNCPGCHVHHAELLTVDHVNGDGSWYRKGKGRSTRDYYRDVLRQGFPPTYQLLCGSCNLAKGDGPACPLAGQDH